MNHTRIRRGGRMPIGFPDFVIRFPARLLRSPSPHPQRSLLNETACGGFRGFGEEPKQILARY